MSTGPLPSATVEEYLEFDRKSEFKNEYVFGEIVAMTGGTPWHSLIVMNTAFTLNKKLFGSTCHVFDSSLRVCLDRETLYSYPDITVVCGALEYTDDRRETVLNPKLVVEVLSPSTRNYDLGDKARMYSRIPSLAELLLIEQRACRIEHWRRQPNGHWDVELIEDPGATVNLESLGCEVPVAEVYSGVEFEVNLRTGTSRPTAGTLAN
jgi:Uma2 family endonuclease